MKEFIQTPLTLSNGDAAQIGDVIRWNCWDSDDYTNWEFTGLYKGNKIIYLGGGIDFGSAIGKELTVQEVIYESENNDDAFTGIEKVGEARDLAKLIKTL